MTIHIPYLCTGLGIDYQELSSSITSSVGDSTVYGSVRINNDNSNEDPEMFTIQIVNCTNTAASCEPAVMNTTLSITINDDTSDGMYCKGYKLVGH